MFTTTPQRLRPFRSPAGDLVEANNRLQRRVGELQAAERTAAEAHRLSQLSGAAPANLQVVRPVRSPRAETAPATPRGPEPHPARGRGAAADTTH